MISEKEVLESLDHLGEKLLLVREENNKQRLEVERLENENKEISEELKQARVKYGKALSVIRYVVENTIEGHYEHLVKKLEDENKALGERCIQLQKDKGDLVDKVKKMKADTERLKASVDAKDKSLEAINNRLKSFSKESSELDIDSMITKIHNNDVKHSEVDAKLKEIRNERFTIQYEWGRATKDTEKRFVDFVKRLWDDYAVIGNYKVLNKINAVKDDLDDNTLNTFIRFLLDRKLIERRDNGETVSTAELEKVVDVITKVC
ncbi:MAG: hypothetical protein II304_02435 [Bacteroidales bacterium]|nr:hypothetical protein [Bacteroidales bacterium]